MRVAFWLAKSMFRTDGTGGGMHYAARDLVCGIEQRLSMFGLEGILTYMTARENMSRFIVQNGAWHSGNF